MTPAVTYIGRSSCWEIGITDANREGREFAVYAPNRWIAGRFLWRVRLVLRLAWYLTRDWYAGAGAVQPGEAMTRNWTEEPWSVDHTVGCIRGNNGLGVLFAQFHESAPCMERAVACVNAMANRNPERLGELVARTKALATKLRVCIPRIQATETMAYVHGSRYSGPTFGEDLTAVEESLRAFGEVP